MTSWLDKRVVYTLSSKGRLIQDTIRSVRSLCRWVPPEQVTIFFTPPREHQHIECLSRLGVDVREAETETTPFAKNRSNPPRHYAEKLKLTGIEADNVLFLDCDTIVLSDPSELFGGEAEFKARPGSADLHLDSWYKLFDQFDRPPIDWMPNAGVLVFQGGLHRRIRDDWEQFIHAELEFDAGGTTHHEQYALALAVAPHTTAKLSEKQHVMEWADEPQPEGVVYHHGLDPGTPPSGIYDAIRALYRMLT